MPRGTPKTEGTAVTDTPSTARPLAVPAGRLNRFARLGGMTAGIAGNMALQDLSQVGRGARPDMRGLLLTPGNVRRLAKELARMRGAAMKVGQLISMDTGEVLPPDLAAILARLRDQAHFMPPAQLKQVLTRGWAAGWLRSFRHFEVRPIAAASIGQVHRARLKDGRDVAIKVQFPGIARSIDSDVANLGVLMRVSGLLPSGFDLAPYLDEARRRLHGEADYAREGAQLRRFARLLEGSDSFDLPDFHADWSTPEILTMSDHDGRPIETAAAAPRDVRNRITAALIELTQREVFEFGVVQSDPNFANYRYDSDSGRIILLDFGATRDLDADLAEPYRRLLRAGLTGEREDMHAVARELRLIECGGAFDGPVLAMIHTVFDAIRDTENFDFGDRSLTDGLRRQGIALSEAGYVPPPLLMDMLYLQRKVGGMFLLGSRLGAVLPLRALLERYLRCREPNGVVERKTRNPVQVH